LKAEQKYFGLKIMQMRHA